jgi:ABC-2 type transport system ATP-binding protein
MAPVTEQPILSAGADGAGRIVLRGLTRRFGAVLALQPTDLEIEAGTVTGLLGPNGSGKSTLLRALIGLVRPDSGGAVVDGVPLAGDGTAVRRRCTFAPGEIALYGEFRAREQLDWLLRGREREALSRARAMAQELGLPLAARVHTYSHGMKRQLLFTAAMAPRVRVRILDEPSEGLDPNKRGAVLDLIATDARAGTTVLLSSHHLGEVDRVCSRMVFLARGKVIRDEDAASVRARSARLLRVEFAPEAERSAAWPDVRARLATLEGAVLHLRGTRAAFELASDDPRAFLARLLAVRDLPSPRAIEYGRLSLQELYTDLYGVEAV